MKNFNDLQFIDHPIARHYKGAKYATMNFDNEYGVSVIFGECFYSNGIDTYELAVLYKGGITYNTEITDDVIGYISENEVTEIMIKIQKL